MYYIFASLSDLLVTFIRPPRAPQLVRLVEYRSRTVTIYDSCADGTKWLDRCSCCGCLVDTVYSAVIHAR